ncbi:hypothetical protein PRZ48_011169 [Zasmidium cellare]|uniref:Carrier domain-containing protein n=1 Tax=Zasmidium cellare TaxID=395010 RepID=A0ABR0EAM5_ZASCE|nr:hypothetical protein PRZ48_011169 [Zasmidium cellare]
MGDISEQELLQIWSWNAKVPETVDDCVHDVFSRTARKYPHSVAVCAWDGEWTYFQLDDLSNRLARHLIATVPSGNEENEVVPLVFEKSKWTPVAMLAAFKAGLAIVTLDINLPEQRLDSIIQQVKPRIALSSKAQTGKATLMMSHIENHALVTVDRHLFHTTLASHPDLAPLPTVSSAQKLYIVFTSGSTGTPKGAIITHSNLCSAAAHQQAALGFTTSTRLYDYSSYAFDVSYDSLHALMAGGCLCIPSEQDRLADITESIIKLRANYLRVTPTASRLLDASRLDQVQTVSFIGEPLKASDLVQWQGQRIYNTYGPCECSITSTASLVEDWNDPDIGTGLGLVTWVVDTENGRLQSIGDVGELFLEGPLVGAGYWNDHEKTAAAFIQDPSWLVNSPSSVHPGRHGKLYRTGDLVRYTGKAGKLSFVGRSDNQVKLNGQRVELGDIESNIARLFRLFEPQVVVEVIKLQDTQETILVGSIGSHSVPFDDLEVAVEATDLRAVLADSVPQYMIPRVLIPLQDTPVTPTGKTDRRRIREIARSVLEAQSSQAAVFPQTQKPGTDMEKVLQRLWAQALAVPVLKIAIGHSFFELGGDSLKAIRLAALARKQGFQLTVPQMLKHPKLSEQALLMAPISAHVEYEDLQPFSLVPTAKAEALRIQAAAQCGVQPLEVADLYPCTPMQTGLLALSTKKPGHYIARGKLRFKSGVDLERFKASWETVVAQNAILRTRIVDLAGSFYQAVIDKPVQWRDTGIFGNEAMEIGKPLLHVAIVAHRQDQLSTFEFAIHHSLYDGWSMSVLLQHLAEVYSQSSHPRKLVPFRAFINHIVRTGDDTAREYWTSEFEGLEAPQWPQLPSNGYQPTSDASIRRSIRDLKWPTSDITPNTLIRSAWALLLSTYTRCDDAKFGAVVLGRQAPVVGIDALIGPTIAAVPIRIRTSPSQSISSLLASVQKQAADMIPVEQTGLTEIERISPGSCQFQSLLVVQPDDNNDDSSATTSLFADGLSNAVTEGLDAFTTYALTIQCTLSSKSPGLSVDMTFDTAVVSQIKAERILGTFENILRQLCALAGSGSGHTTAQIKPISQQDELKVRAWNKQVPAAAVEDIVDTILRNMKEKPDAPAICAWDGDLTYGELDELSSALANTLHLNKVGKIHTIPLIFEKSKWMTVAQLAVVRTGAACLNLDPEFPLERLRYMIGQVSAPVIIASRSLEEKAKRLSTAAVLIAAENHRANATEIPRPFQPTSVRSADPVYIQYTSGTTSTPKGTVITRGNLSSAFSAQRKAFALDASSRVYDHSSYSFDNHWLNVWYALASGACLCVPSQESRLDDVSGSIRRLRANWALLIPNVARFIGDETLRSMHSLYLGAESASLDQLERFSKSVATSVAYGPSESTIVSTISRRYSPRSGTSPKNIGRGVGVTTWIVDRAGHCLSPIGAVGELWISGDQVAAGYLGDSEKTAQAFFSSAPWLGALPDEYSERGRLYSTGDLVYYNDDGEIIFVGRKDTQVKVRGIRVELDEVEQHLRSCLPEAYSSQVEVVAEVFQPQSSEAAILAAFIGLPDEVRESVWQSLASIDSVLAEVAPKAMIPSAFVALQRVPLSATGKTDRRKLRELGSSMTIDELNATHPARSKEKRLPTTEMEIALQLLFSDILGVDPEHIGADDNVFTLGMDSIIAMRVVGAARERGLTLSVSDIFTSPRLCDLALKVGRLHAEDTQEDLAAFALLPRHLDIDAVRQQVAAACGIDSALVEDVYPASALQEGLIAMTVKHAGDYALRVVLELDDKIDLDRFRTAWDQVQQRMPILRTRMVGPDFPDLPLVQAVIDEPIAWNQQTSLEECIRLEPSMGLNKPLSNFALVLDPDTGKRLFVLSIHHALYDGWSTQLLHDEVVRAYMGEAPQTLVPFNRFISYTNGLQGQSEFWEKYLQGCEAMVFPSLPSISYQPRADDRVECEFVVDWPRVGVTPSNAVRAAWAVLLSRYCDSEDVVFGATVSGRQAPVAGINKIAAPTLATLPVRVALSKDMTIDQLLESVQNDAVATILYEQFGLQNISKASGDAESACKFQTIVVIQPKTEARSDFRSLTEVFGKQIDAEDAGTFSTYAVMVECELRDEGMHLRLLFDSKVITSNQAQRLVHQLERILVQLCSDVKSGIRVGDVDPLTNEELSLIWSWNEALPEAVDGLMHEVIAERSRARPNAQAIESWDGSLTYAELDAWSTRLAQHLVHQGVRPGQTVPVCFEKSLFMPVSALAVWKAGAACVALDVSQPLARLQSIVEQVHAPLILCSPEQKHLAMQLDRSNTILVDKTSLDDEFANSTNTAQLPSISSSSPLYLAFTSGSTGTPKGAIISHTNAVTSCRYQLQPLGFHANARVYDFASYAFDVAWGNLFRTLASGACLCIPSESDRKSNIAASIRALKANQASFTPTMARLFQPSDLPTLEILRFGGEKLEEADLAPWRGKLKTMNVYGPAEVTPISTIAYMDEPTGLKAGIGKGFGVCTWLVDVKDSSRLAPIGGLGELWLEGPLVGVGYTDPEQTANAFYDEAPWLSKSGSSHGRPHGRLYRTGDVCKYNEDSSLVFVGRKDSQVKVRGQRLELGDVEHLIRRQIPTGLEVQVAAEVMVPRGSDAPCLVAFLSSSSKNQATDTKDGSVKNLIRHIDAELAQVAPTAMLPSAYIELPAIPTNASGKTDRRQLRAIGSSMTLEELAVQHPSRTERQPPQTERELQIRDLFASVLGIDPSTIGRDDSFMRIGGDSIRAMRLSAAAKASTPSLRISVADILTYPRVKSLAEVAQEMRDGKELEMVRPFSLLPSAVDVASVRREAAALCPGLVSGQIKDAYPVTPLQAGLMALTSKRPGDYIAHFQYQLHQDVDEHRFRQAWEAIARTDILRTRIVDIPSCGGLIQVVTDQHAEWHQAESLEYLDRLRSKDNGMGLGTPLVRVALIPHGDKKLFSLSMHHAIYDGWSLELLLKAVEEEYMDTPYQLRPFNLFIKHLHDAGSIDVDDYWRKQFEGAEAVQFPDVSSAGPNYVPRSDQRRSLSVDNLTWPKANSFTTASLIRAAWALLISHYTAVDESVFGAVLNGRQASVPGIEDVAGPTLATAPVRVAMRANSTESLEETIARIHRQAIDMTPFEQTGLHRIRKVSSHADQCCNFQSLLVVQAAGTSSESSVFAETRGDVEDGPDTFSTYAILLDCRIRPDGLKAQASFDSNLIHADNLERLLASFETILRQLCSVDLSKASINDIEVSSRQDLDKIRLWNEVVPEAVDETIHDLITKRVSEHSEKEAVCSHDGNLTYSALDDLATQLACQILAEIERSGNSSTSGKIIPIFSDKSMWVPVCMLATAKAGLAFLTLDVKQPFGRLSSIVRQVEAPLVLSSTACLSLARSLSDNVLEVSHQTLSSMPNDNGNNLPLVSPNDLLYVVYTSGSTGQPKGACISHRNFASAVKYQQKALGFNANSRVYQWASYAFDVSISDCLHTLTAGGTLCVPSEEDRLHNIAHSIQKLDANYTHMTPTTSRLLEDVPQLKTIQFSGETLRRADLAKWSNGSRQIINSFGPAECSVTATVANLTTEDNANHQGDPSIGMPVGGVAWVVNTSTGQLSAIGAVGELFIQGPLAGQGYLHDPEKTKAAFIENPAWLLAAGGQGLVYRTGDMASLRADGSLSFIGRRDSQVKIRGQRLELGEVEHHVRKSLNTSSPEKVQVVAEVVDRAGGQQLVAFVSLPQESFSPVTVQELEQLSNKLTAGIEEKLVENVPMYMVPSLFIPLTSIPVTATGKTDRRRLREIGAAFAVQDVIPTQASAARQPRTEVEKQLAEIWSQVLNIPLASISLDDLFIRLGGDSISAMQIVSRARQHGISTTVTDVLQAQTIEKLASKSQVTKKKTQVSKQIDEETTDFFPLSPIQRLFFQNNPQGSNQFNQSFLLKINRSVTPSSFARAVDVLVARHAMLRARFRQIEQDHWQQYIETPGSSMFLYGFEEHHVTDTCDVQSVCQRRQEMLDIQQGPVFAVDLFNVPNGAQTVLFTANHLVIDLVSWRVIWHDLEQLLTKGIINEPKPSSFATWIRAQIRDAEELQPDNTVHDAANVSASRYWEVSPKDNTRGNAETFNFRLGAESTSNLVRDIDHGVRTEPMDVILGALLHAFQRIFQDRKSPAVFLEGHGREPLSHDDVDISNTVGWFTTIYPLNLDATADEEVLHTIRCVKDARRRAAANVRASFTSRFHNAAGKGLPGDEPAEILFNFTGVLQQLEGETPFFSQEDRPELLAKRTHVHSGVRRFAYIEINCGVENGELELSFIINKSLKRQDLLLEWMTASIDALKNGIPSISNSHSPFSLSDFPMLSITYAALDQILRSLIDLGIPPNNVHDIYPTSPL